MISKLVKKTISFVVGMYVIIAIGFTWYDAGFMMVDTPSRVDEISIYNSIYMLENGDVIRQRFVPQKDYLKAIELIMVNTSEEDSGELVIQVLDMWGEVLGETRHALADMESGVYERIDLNMSLPVAEGEEFQICFYPVNADVVPGIVVVPFEDGVIENGICFYNDEIIAENGLVIGYIYGNREFVRYEYQERSVITVAIVKSITLFFGGVTCIALTYFFKPKKIKEVLWNYGIFSEFCLISILFALFLLSATINKCAINDKIPHGVYIYWSVTLLLCGWTGYLYMKNRSGKRKKKMKRVDRRGILFLGTISVLLRLPMFTHIQRWDGSVYYAELHTAGINFDFTFQSVWENFRFAEHPTFSYSFFMLMGEFLFPGKVIGALLVQLVLTVAGIICIYLLFRRYWSHMAAVPAMIFTLLISVTPLFYGTFSYINVDYTLVLFFVFLLYSVYKKKMVLAAFWTVAIMLNKETGWVIVAGYYFGYFIEIWLDEKGKTVKEKIKRLFKNKMLYIMLFGIMILGFYMIRQGGVSGWFAFGKYSSIFVTAEDVAEKGWFVNGIGFFPKYILHRLSQMFMINFLWIPTLIIAVSCTILLYNKGKMWEGGIRNLSGMICSLVTFGLFSVFYVTAPLVRYTVFSSVFLWILAVLLLYYVLAPVMRSEILVGGLGSVMIMLLVQNVFFVDPISNLLYERLDSGKGIILSTEQNTGYFGDTLINNYRFRYLDGLLDKMLTNICYDEDVYIFQYDDESHIKGISAIPLGWDKEKKERRFTSEDTQRRYGEIISLNVINVADVETISQDMMPQKAIVYFVPYCNEGELETLDMLRLYYQIGERTEISNWGGSLYYYELKRK